MTLTPIAVKTRDAAHFLGISEDALRSRQAKGTGPKSFNYGKKDVMYLVHELEKWVLEKAGVDYEDYIRETKTDNDNDVQPEPKRGRGRPKGSTKKKKND